MDYLDIKELYHHGIKGQKWGIRRYQNDDGTLTAEGRKRYGVDYVADMSKEQRNLYEQDRKEALKSAKEDIKRQGLTKDIDKGSELISSKYGKITLDDFMADTQNKANKIALGVTIAGFLATVGLGAYMITDSFKR